MLNSATAIKKYLKQFQKIDLLPRICRIVFEYTITNISSSCFTTRDFFVVYFLIHNACHLSMLIVKPP